MVGIGTQDSFEQAQDFVADTGVTFEMLWEPGSASWQAYEVVVQPEAVLVAPDGTILARWPDLFEAADVLDVLDG